MHGFHVEVVLAPQPPHRALRENRRGLAAHHAIAVVASERVETRGEALASAEQPADRDILRRDARKRMDDAAALEVELVTVDGKAHKLGEGMHARIRPSRAGEFHLTTQDKLQSVAQLTRNGSDGGVLLLREARECAATIPQFDHHGGCRHALPHHRITATTIEAMPTTSMSQSVTRMP